MEETFSGRTDATSDEVTILHLSDLHFGIKPSRKNLQKYIDKRNDAMRDFFKGWEEDDPENPGKKKPSKNFIGWKPDIIAISGDIGWAGLADDYRDFVNAFFHELLTRTEIETKNIILCPGNHDRRDDLDCSEMGADGNPVSFHGDNAKVGSGNVHLWEKLFLDYETMCKDQKFIELTANPHNNYIFGQRTISVGGHDIKFIVLNSAWLCYHDRKNDSDRGKLSFGMELLNANQELFYGQSKGNSNNRIITMFHHPCSENEGWFRVEEIRETWNTVRNNSDIVLNGHEHVFGTDRHDHATDVCAVYKAGTLHSTDSVDYGCEFLKLDFKNQITKRCAYAFSHNIGDNWRWIPFDDDQWKPANILAAERDKALRERQQAEEKLQETQKRLNQEPEIGDYVDWEKLSTKVNSLEIKLFGVEAYLKAIDRADSLIKDLEGFLVKGKDAQAIADLLKFLREILKDLRRNSSNEKFNAEDGYTDKLDHVKRLIKKLL